MSECYRCEKPIRPAVKVWHVHVIEGGEDMGWHPVGADCARTLKGEGAEVERLAAVK